MKTGTTRILCIIFALVCGGNLIAQDHVEKAKALWEKVIEAKGGRKNLYAVKNLVVSTSLYSPYDRKDFRNSKYEEFYVLPDKFWWWMDDRPGFDLSIWQTDFGSEFGYVANDGKPTGVWINEAGNISEYGKQFEYEIFQDYILWKIRPKKISRCIEEKL